MCKKVWPDSESPTFLPGPLTHSVSGLVFFLDVFFSPLTPSSLITFLPSLGCAKRLETWVKAKELIATCWSSEPGCVLLGWQGRNCPPLALRQQQKRSF